MGLSVRLHSYTCILTSLGRNRNHFASQLARQQVGEGGGGGELGPSSLRDGCFVAARKPLNLCSLPLLLECCLPALAVCALIRQLNE